MQVALLFSSYFCPQMPSCELCPCSVKSESKSRCEHTRLLCTSVVRLHYWLFAKAMLGLIAFTLHSKN